MVLLSPSFLAPRKTICFSPKIHYMVQCCMAWLLWPETGSARLPGWGALNMVIYIIGEKKRTICKQQNRQTLKATKKSWAWLKIYHQNEAGCKRCWGTDAAAPPCTRAGVQHLQGPPCQGFVACGSLLSLFPQSCAATESAYAVCNG